MGLLYVFIFLFFSSPLLFFFLFLFFSLLFFSLFFSLSLSFFFFLNFACELSRHGYKEKTNMTITEDLTLVVLGDLSVGHWYSGVLCHQAVFQAAF